MSSPPSRFYQTCQVYWGNPYALANSNDDSNHSNNVPLAVDMRATAIGVSTSVANLSAVVACVSAASVDVSAAPVDLCPLDAAIADVSNAAVDASAYFTDTSADVDVANISACRPQSHYIAVREYNVRFPTRVHRAVC